MLSDMRQETPELNLAPAKTTSLQPELDAVRRQRLIPDLKRVDVYVLGADNAGRDIGYWQTLRDFWQAYFQATGANLRSYSVSRELPE